MVGGPNSFASGQWNETPVGKMLPVELIPAGRDWDQSITTVHPLTTETIHPIWHISSDEAQNRSLLKTLPNFLGTNRVGRVKTGADVLARTDFARRRWRSGCLRSWSSRTAAAVPWP